MSYDAIEEHGIYEAYRLLRADLQRATAVIADQFGAGRPAVKESAEELAEWAEEFTDRYFATCDTRYRGPEFEPSGNLDEQGFAT